MLFIIGKTDGDDGDFFINRQPERAVFERCEKDFFFWNSAFGKNAQPDFFIDFIGRAQEDRLAAAQAFSIDKQVGLFIKKAE